MRRNRAMSAERKLVGRRYDRLPIRLPVRLTAEGLLFRKTLELECRDVSGGGLAVETSASVRLTARTRVVLGELGDLPSSARIEGRVVYRKRDPATGRTSIGIEFTRFVETTREELVESISHWPNVLHSPS